MKCKIEFQMKHLLNLILKHDLLGIIYCMKVFKFIDYICEFIRSNKTAIVYSKIVKIVSLFLVIVRFLI